VLQDFSHGAGGARSTPSALGRGRSRTGTTLPELLVTRHSEVIAVEATVQTDWTTDGVSHRTAGERLRKRAQLHGFILNIAQAIPAIHKPRMRITVVFIAPGRPQGQTINAIRSDLRRIAGGVQVEIRWLVVPSV
jgi:hypothetical protein